MIKKGTIPEIIKKAFAFETKNCKGEIKPLGIRDGVEWFFFKFSEILETGFPVVYGLKDGKIKELYGLESLRLVNSFFKN
nr:MAG TPA: hypothetical protein [Caudoviricetes sp.]